MVSVCLSACVLMFLTVAIHASSAAKAANRTELGLLGSRARFSGGTTHKRWFLQ